VDNSIPDHSQVTRSARSRHKSGPLQWSLVCYLWLDSSDQAPARARRAIEHSATLLGNRASDVLLLTSELVTNSVRHAGNTIHGVEVAITLSAKTVRLQVTDDGEGFDIPQPPAVAKEELFGRGLVIVDKLADRWGMQRLQEGRTSVWAEMGPEPSLQP
jgi:anti-sigma regulatory factor (Ser/Thr protein kinase)